MVGSQIDIKNSGLVWGTLLCMSIYNLIMADFNLAVVKADNQTAKFNSSSTKAISTAKNALVKVQCMQHTQ